MDTKSLAPTVRIDHPAPPKERKCCAVCGEPAGSVSAGTGRPLIRDRATGEMAHVSCGPGVSVAALDAMVQAPSVVA